MNPVEPRLNLRGLADRTTAALVFGLSGLFILNIIFGPLAIALGAIAARGTRRGTRDQVAALAAVMLGTVDLIVLAVTVAAHVSGGALHLGG